MTPFSLPRLQNILKSAVSAYTPSHQKAASSAAPASQHPILRKKTLLFLPQNIAFLHPEAGMQQAKCGHLPAKNKAFCRQKVQFLPLHLRYLSEKTSDEPVFPFFFFYFNGQDFAITLSMSGLQKITPFFPPTPAFGPKQAILRRQKRQSVKMTNEPCRVQRHSSSMPQR